MAPAIVCEISHRSPSFQAPPRSRRSIRLILPGLLRNHRAAAPNLRNCRSVCYNKASPIAAPALICGVVCLLTGLPALFSARRQILRRRYVLMLTFTGRGTAQTCNGVTRRDFLQVGTLGAIGLSLPQLFAAQAQGAVAKGNDKRSAI